ATDVKYEYGEPFLRDIVSKFKGDESAEREVRNALKHLTLFDSSPIICNQYMDYFVRAKESDIDIDDFAAFGVLLSRDPKEEITEVVIRAESLLSKLRDSADARLRPNISYVQYFRMQRFIKLGEEELAIK